MRVATLLRLSVATAVVTIVLKTAAWWVTGSVGLLSDALESLVNLATDVKNNSGKLELVDASVHTPQ